jgi:hypothetical protein
LVVAAGLEIRAALVVVYMWATAAEMEVAGASPIPALVPEAAALAVMLETAVQAEILQVLVPHNLAAARVAAAVAMKPVLLAAMAVA